MSQGVLSTELFLEGEVVREPVGSGEGYWVGAPGIFRDTDGVFYLTYRVRRPRGVEPDRGGVARIARSTDGVNFEDIWEVGKAAYESTSIERSAIRRGEDGQWRYFTSYVDPADGRWCTTMLVADRPDGFDAGRGKRLFTAAELGLEGVKDPFVTTYEGGYAMLLSVALPTAQTGESAHATQDIYNTGQCVSATALATSADLDRWNWQGVVFEPMANAVGQRWDGYCRRINSAIRVGDSYVGFFDGSRSHEQNYEECTGLARSDDLRRWRSVSEEGPAVLCPEGSGSIRYVDVWPMDGELRLYYEISRADGAHELRTAVVAADGLAGV